MDIDALIHAAWSVRDRAYAPYSRFAVGAALLCLDGRIFTGCNVENLSFGLTICAERNALFSAVAAGYQEFVAIAIVADSIEPISPCGGCRQVLAEFSPAMRVFSETPKRVRFTSTLAELLPRAKTGILEQGNCST